MSPSLKAFLALIFVAVMGAVLIRPILNSVDVESVAAPDEEAPSTLRPKASPSPSPSPRPSPTPENSPTSEGGLVAGPFRTQPLLDRYPTSCLRPPANEGEGLIATMNGGRVTFGTTAGSTDPGGPGGTTPGKVKTLLGFNRTADTYAVRGTSGGILLAPPEGFQGADGKLPFGKITGHTWSPLSPCSLSTEKNGALLVPQSRGPARLVSEGVESVAFSPDGRSVAVVIEEGETTSVWVAELNGTDMREVQRERTGPRITLESWSPDGRALYLSVGRNSGVSFVSQFETSAPPLSGRVGGGRVTSFEQCEDRLLAIVNGGIADISTKGPNYLTDTNAGYTAISCAPNGAFIAALREGNLFLLDSEGSELRDLTTDTGFRDVFVDWGEAGAGLLFGRVPSGGGPAQVWHIAEGGTARNTGLVFTPGPGAIDWAASPPTGLPLP